MTEKKGVQFEGKEEYVKEVFYDISNVYDKVNNIMTFGMVAGWQRFVIAKTGIGRGGKALDVGCGTGEIAFMLANTVGESGTVTGLDLSSGMLNVARQKAAAMTLPCAVDFIEGSALELPFEDNSFDALTSGFMLRNVTDLDRTIGEMQRVTRPGGKVVCLEIAEPKFILFKWGFRFYFGKCVPFIGHFFDKGKSVEGRQAPYVWLRDSFQGFPYGEDMAEIFRNAGLKDVKFYAKTFGSVNIYEGTK